MSEENKNNIDDFIDDEEYAKAIAALETSKSIRLKENSDKKKAEAKAKKEAEAKKRKEEAQKRIEKSGIKNPFIAKCVADPIIPTCIIVAILAVVGILCYILIPMFSTPAMKFNLTEFKTRYTSTTIYAQSLAPFSFQIPDMTYTEVNPQPTASSIALTADPNALNPVNAVDSSKLYYFSGLVSNNATSLGIGIQGSCRRSDNKLTAIRTFVEYSASDDYYNFILIYFASYFQTIYPELTAEQALDLSQAAIADFQSNNFIVNGDYAYRVVMENSGVVYFALDIVPAEQVSRG